MQVHMFNVLERNPSKELSPITYHNFRVLGFVSCSPAIFLTAGGPTTGAARRTIRRSHQDLPTLTGRLSTALMQGPFVLTNRMHFNFATVIFALTSVPINYPECSSSVYGSP